MPLPKQPENPRPGPLDLPTPTPDAHGLIDLSGIVAAAYATAGCGFEDVDPEYWRVGDDWRTERETVAYALLAGWHGLPADSYGRLKPCEEVYLAGAKKVSAMAVLVRGARGIWLMGVSIATRSTNGGTSFHVWNPRGYVDRATALRHAARIALAEFGLEGGYRRIHATLERMAEFETEDA